MFSILKIVSDLLNVLRKEIIIRKATNALSKFSDRDLEDMGLSRHNLHAAVRYGRRQSI
ncbi:DUF1127 domain-containing protein [Thiothrix subterranea]|uniref:DUF1127 domain-containing protein n=1 Tax=Thiothrix subterranea TaxID=2735563 RepID=A0AA51QVZ0_9GAMM|nr:DUF1127 domain-containing protein [Thiothrix subterranea]MDQ5767641.1 DUF1127 domain-containing protein [Thiothrix subterranea]WML85448.1 DUF1127 domain-containing protein [Thiothrix subterranea]